jgi:hypothetical protein
MVHGKPTPALTTINPKKEKLLDGFVEARSFRTLTTIMAPHKDSRFITGRALSDSVALP